MFIVHDKMPCQSSPLCSSLLGMRLFQQRDVYYIEFPGGKRRSLKTKDGRKAKGLFREIEKERLRGNLIKLEKNAGVTLGRFKKLYINDPERSDLSGSTSRADELALRKLMDITGDIPMDHITKTHIIKFKHANIENGVKPVSVNSYLGHIKAALNYAKTNEYIKTVPAIKMFKLGDKIPRVISEYDIDKILEQARKTKPEMYRIIQFALYTGARREEIVLAKYEHIRGGSIKILGKGKKERIVPLVKYAREILEDQQIGKLFSYNHVSTVSNYYRKITREAGVESRFHDLRHTAATLMLSKGVDLAVVQKILGHADIKTTQIYAEVLQAMLEKEMKKLEE